MMDHPLTDEICDSIAPLPLKHLCEGERYFATHAARWGADWQLECDAEWWKILLNRMKILHPNAVDLIVEEFKQKMRPQQQEINNA